MKLLFTIGFFLASLSLFAQDTLIRLSHQGGQVDTLELVATASRGQLRYTTNGQTPGQKSKPWPGTLQIKKTTLVRWACIEADTVSSQKTALYLIGFESTFPVLSLATSPHNLWDSLRGIYVKGSKAQFDTIGNYWRGANYWKKWEKPVQISFYETDGSLALSQDAGLRIFGGMTRQRNEKSLRIIARNKYGDSRFRHKLFAGRDQDKFKHLLVRTSGNDAKNTRFRDVLATQLAKELDLDIQEYRPTHLFMNGKYWGVYNLRERIGKQYLARNFGANPDSTDLLQGRRTAEEGSAAAYDSLLAYVRANDLANPAHFSEVEKRIDVSNYLNFMVAQIYLGNIDARGNIRFWRSASTDGRFRWIVYDTDLGFGKSSYARDNYLADCLSPAKTKWYNPQWSTFLLRNLMKNEGFKNTFINQVAYTLSTTFSTEHVLAKLEELTATYAPEMQKHLRRRSRTMASWKYALNNVATFAKKRPAYLLAHTQEQFGLADTYVLQIKNKNPGGGGVRINNNATWDKSLFSGSFFNNVPIKIELQANPLYAAAGQDAFYVEGNNKDTLFVEVDFIRLPRSRWSGKVLLNELNLANQTSSPGDWLELYNTTGATLFLEGWAVLDESNMQSLPSTKLVEFGVFAAEPRRYTTHFKQRPQGLLPLRLNAQKETLWLLDSHGHMVDSLTWEQATTEPFVWDRALPTDTTWRQRSGYGTPGKKNPAHIAQEQRKKQKTKLLCTILLTLLFGAGWWRRRGLAKARAH